MSKINKTIKITRSYRLSPKTLNLLSEMAHIEGDDLSEIIEKLIVKHSGRKYYQNFPAIRKILRGN